MSRRVLFVVLLHLFEIFVSPVTSVGNYVGQNSIGKQFEYLDANGVYLVEWEAYTDTETIIFDLTVATTGFVGFGIFPAGGMTGADIIIGGVHSNGSVYFSNRHGVGNQMPVLDDSETWELLQASENSTHTHLKVGRLFNTCNSQDVPIGNSTNNFIWSFGQTDVITYHGSNNRGTSANIILDPPMPALDISKYEMWRMTNTMVMPAKKTTYWCTVQKSPVLPSKHHIVGFRPILNTPEALKHTHHFIVHKCRAPDGSTAEETFDRFVGQPGAECYVGSPNVPMRYCESYLFLWAVCGKPVSYPDHVGYPFAVEGRTSYYLLEVHFDNPESLQGLTFETGLELFYTPNLRPNDAGTITSGHATSWAITIPPNSGDHMVVGHCSPSCSSNIPEAGINVFNVLLHSHLAGRKLKLRHYRDGKELAWLGNDENYNFDYQQNRVLLEEVKLMPGDQLTYECTYNSMQANGTVIGGLATTDEMCNAFILYYPEIGLDVCSSEFPRSELMKEFGIETIRSPFNTIQDPMILAPENLANKTYTQVLNTMIPWEEYRDHFQEKIRYGDHNIVCGMGGLYIPHSDTIQYPNITKEYVPIDECATRGSNNNQAVIRSSLYLACVLAIMPLIFNNVV